MANPIEVQLDRHVIRFDCPHVEDGACSKCIVEQVIPYVSSRAANEWILERLAKLGPVMHEFSSWAGKISKSTEKIVEGARAMEQAKWTLDEDPPPRATAPNWAGEEDGRNG